MPQAQINLIAALAGADPRTVRRHVVDGKPVHGKVLRERIEVAAKHVGAMPKGDPLTALRAANDGAPSSAA